VIDVDSFVGEVCGRLKQGAGYGYTRVLGYHPLLATRADTRETLHIRLRKGWANTQKGIKRFCDELIARVERAGATGVKLLRADSGFWNSKVLERLERAGWQYSIGVRMIKTSVPRSRRSTRTPGSRSTTPTRARPRSPRPSTASAG
jgi:Transposase DDE domain.